MQQTAFFNDWCTEILIIEYFSFRLPVFPIYNDLPFKVDARINYI